MRLKRSGSQLQILFFCSSIGGIKRAPKLTTISREWWEREATRQHKSVPFLNISNLKGINLKFFLLIYPMESPIGFESYSNVRRSNAILIDNSNASKDHFAFDPTDMFSI